jgi:hypothetical protein
LELKLEAILRISEKSPNTTWGLTKGYENHHYFRISPAMLLHQSESIALVSIPEQQKIKRIDVRF